LLRQVIGRVGRGHRTSNVVIQTYNPGGKLLQSITNNDWSSYYDNEIAEREEFMFPPFCFLLKLWCRRASQSAAQNASEALAAQLRNSGLQIIVEGPAPAFHEKVTGKYQWQLIIKAKRRGQLLNVIENLPSGWSHDIDPMNLL
jgi:primosomal protein N' (replication factor Y)